MAKNRNLNTAARAKKDEFYTQLADIERELYHYQKFFKGKVVLCNCDDPYESNFFKYFTIFFTHLELKKLIATCYAGSPVVQTELDFFGTPNENPHFDKRTQAIKFEVNEIKDLNGDGAADLLDVRLLLETDKNSVTYLEGGGDFRSPECIEALKEADIVVTNPPFSLFREYVAQLIRYDKKFLIIGNKNAITYKEIFPLIMQNKIWTGYTSMSREVYFKVPQSYIDEGLDKGKDRSIVFHGGKYMARSQAIWFTNLDVSRRHETIPLFKRYADEPELFPHYDNYDAIEVPKTAFIPCDYFGVMGVPITFLDKYNPDQFEIIGLDRYTVPKEFLVGGRVAINGKPCYARILIRRRN